MLGTIATKGRTTMQKKKETNKKLKRKKIFRKVKKEYKLSLVRCFMFKNNLLLDIISAHRSSKHGDKS